MTHALHGGPDCAGPDRAGTGGNAEELAFLREHLLAEPSDPDALVRAGALLYQTGRFEEAAAHLNKAMACSHRPPRDGNGKTSEDAIDLHHRILLQLGDCHAALDDFQQSERYCLAALALAPDRAGPHVSLGTLAMQDGQVDRARDFFQKARQLQPDCSEAYAGLAMIHQQRREHSMAFEMYLRCLELDTNNLVALLGLFQTSCQMGSFSQIIHYLETYLAKHPEDTSVLFCLASLWAKEGRFSEARQAVLDVLTQEPDKPEAADLLAELDALCGGERR
jgi:tetratricopeptide (TPR) repeat protein